MYSPRHDDRADRVTGQRECREPDKPTGQEQQSADDLKRPDRVHDPFR